MAPKKRTNPQRSNKTSKRGDGRRTKGIDEIAAPADADLNPLDRDSLLKLIHATIPLPTREEDCADGSLVFVGGDPGEVVVRVAKGRITVSIFGIVGEGSQTPVVRPQALISLHWKRLPAARLKTILHEMIEAARQLRRAKYRKCERCGETKPPEWMHDTGGCQSCAQRGDVASGLR